MEWLEARFELSRGAKGNVKAMEGLRGFAVLLVFFVHYVALIEPWLDQSSATSSIAHALRTIGNSGVDLFFVLSGYLIYGMLISRQQPIAPYMRRRIIRIYPTFVAVFTIYVAASFILPAERKIPNSLDEALIYLLQNFLLLPGLFPIEPMITVAWSLSYEMFFYLAIPLLIMLLGLRHWQPKWRVALFAGFISFLAIRSALFGGYLPFLMFSAGILLHETIKSRFAVAPGDAVTTLVLGGGLLFMLVPIEGHIGFSWKSLVLSVSFFTLCHVCFTRENSLITRTFSWRAIRWFGNMSYSYYLIHGSVLKAFSMVLAVLLPAPNGHPSLFWALLLPAFAMTILFSAVLFLLVERPLSIAPSLRRQE